MHGNIFFEGETAQWERVDDKIQRQIVGFDDAIMMVRVRFEKGGIGTLHQHVHAQVTHIASGKFDVTIAQETRTMAQGDSFYVPSAVSHGVVCLDAGELIDVFSPMREDFIKQQQVQKKYE